MDATQILTQLVQAAGPMATRRPDDPVRDSYILALKPQGISTLPGQVGPSHDRYHVDQADTELGLRRRLHSANGAPLIMIIDEALALRLPKGLIRRGRGAKVHALALRDVLNAALGVSVVDVEDEGLQKLALEKAGELRDQLRARTLPTVVDRSLFDELMLEVTLGERVRTATPGQLLADWLRGTGEREWSPVVRALAARVLPRFHDVAGELLAWAVQDGARPRQLMLAGIVLAVQLPDDEVPGAAWEPLAELAAGVSVPRSRLRSELDGLVRQTLEALGGSAAQSGLLQEAEGQASQLLGPKHLERHPLLLLGLKNRSQKLAAQMAAGQAVASRELRWLQRHRAQHLYASEIRALEEMGRLCRYLEQGARALEEATVAELVEDYMSHGAFADLAAARLNGALASATAFHGEAKAVMARYRGRRDAQNEAFARLLSRGYTTGLHTKVATPLHRLMRDVAVPAMATDSRDEDGKRGLYLVVMDGCSVPVFLELVHKLAQDVAHPIGLGAGALPQLKVGRTTTLLAAGVSPLPTVTSHARGAIFLGEIPKDPVAAETVWRDGGEAASDPARFRVNTALGAGARRLFLKGDLRDGGAALMQALGDESLEVVAVVFNAIDDQIGSSNTGAAVRVEPMQIKAFLPALKAALDANRRVLITADHGHAGFVDNTYWRGGTTRANGDASGDGDGDGNGNGNGGARYMNLKAGEEAPKGFMVIDVQGLGGKGAGERMAFAWQQGAYLGKPQVAFHGGCSLEEMVVPVAWLEKRGVSAVEPVWWFGLQAGRGGAGYQDLSVEARRQAEVRAARQQVQAGIEEEEAEEEANREREARRRPKAKGKAKTGPAPQLGLFGGADAAAALAGAIDEIGLPAEVLDSLDESERAALVCLKRNGQVTLGDLAMRLGRKTGRLGGMMMRLHRKLHGAGAHHVRFSTKQRADGQPRYEYVGAAGDPAS